MCLARSWVSKYGALQKVLTQPFGLRAFGLLCFPLLGSCLVSSVVLLVAYIIRIRDLCYLSDL